jgi:hypothetical protein
MRVDFVGHASLLVRQGALTLLSDPWWTGGAFGDQWFPYPFPVPERFPLHDLDGLYISHGHEDHLHPGTLKALAPDNPRTRVLIPRRYDAGMCSYIQRLGFANIQELPSGTSTTLEHGPDRLQATIITHLDDSLLVVEADGEVLVNANDALHASRRDVLDEYASLLHARWPRIDYLFCGFGGASYFPNCIHAPGKDDVAVARERELLFLRNFARVAELLEPRLAIPFAAHFVLPEERTWWISATRLAMGSPTAIVRRYLPSRLGARVADLQPGDWVEDGQVHASPAPLLALDQVRTAVLERYPPPAPDRALDRQDLLTLADEIRASAQRTVDRPGADDPFDVELRLWDAPGSALRVRRTDGQVAVALTAPAADAPPAVVETRSAFVRRLMRARFARDLISVGYGAQVYLRDAAAVRSSPHERMLNALSLPTPRWRERLRTDPWRAASFLLLDPSMRYAARRRFLGAANGAAYEPALYDIGDWVSGDLET